MYLIIIDIKSGNNLHMIIPYTYITINNKDNILQ